jgi:hypothetical protein
VNREKAPAPIEIPPAPDIERYVRDLTALLALPAMWTGKSPREIGEGLLDILVDLLRVEIAFARFEDPEGRNAFEAWRPEGASMPLDVEELFRQSTIPRWHWRHGLCRTPCQGSACE